MNPNDKKRSTPSLHEPFQNGEEIPSSQSLRHFAAQAFRRYFKELNGNKPRNLYDFVLREIEKPLIQVALEHTQGNQTEAARLLGVSRVTLRKKLRAHGLPNHSRPA
jgi:Fis family transcriptional regulator